MESRALNIWYKSSSHATNYFNIGGVTIDSAWASGDTIYTVPAGKRVVGMFIPAAGTQIGRVQDCSSLGVIEFSSNTFSDAHKNVMRTFPAGMSFKSVSGSNSYAFNGFLEDDI